MAIFDDVIKNSCQPLGVTWLKELLLKNDKTNKLCSQECLSIVIGELDWHGNVLMNIKRSGKEDLYAELICGLRFGFVRKDGLYDNSLFMEHGISILEDLVIMLADGIASMYLGLVSVDSSMSTELNNLNLSLCTMSTRALRKLRNEAYLKHLELDLCLGFLSSVLNIRNVQLKGTREVLSGAVLSLISRVTFIIIQDQYTQLI